jgi:hypothetical protein
MQHHDLLGRRAPLISPYGRLTRKHSPQTFFEDTSSVETAKLALKKLMIFAFRFALLDNSCEILIEFSGVIGMMGSAMTVRTENGDRPGRHLTGALYGAPLNKALPRSL